MLSRQKKDIDNPFKAADFPVIVEKGKAKAVIMDMEKYREFELLVDNLINLREEDEDAMIKDSGVIEKLIARAREEAIKASSGTNWVEEIDAL